MTDAFTGHIKAMHTLDVPIVVTIADSPSFVLFFWGGKDVLDNKTFIHPNLNQSCCCNIQTYKIQYSHTLFLMLNHMDTETQ